MKITQSKVKNLTAIISVEVNEVDYTEQVTKTLQNYQKTAQTPGFRTGKTPMKIINKKYRTSVVIDEVNKLLQDQLYQYISKHKLKNIKTDLIKDKLKQSRIISAEIQYKKKIFN